jgi:hypothetical protein
MGYVNGFAKAEILELLQEGKLEVEGHLPWSSNYTFLARVSSARATAMAVYKPSRGERPLWDFAQGSLYRRERAAFLVSEALGWELVPPTITRKGPHGPGSLQAFVEHDPECHYFTIEGNELFRRQLQQIVLLDVVINNADRKGGHILVEQDDSQPGFGRLWAIDHGVCFHANYKLRTVVWEFAGERIPTALIADLARLTLTLEDGDSKLSRSLGELLTATEADACLRRIRRLVESGRFSKPGPGRHYPWPPV